MVTAKSWNENVAEKERTQTGRKREGEKYRWRKRGRHRERKNKIRSESSGRTTTLSSTRVLELEALWQKQQPDMEAEAAAMLPFSGLSLPKSDLSCFFLHPSPPPAFPQRS